MAQGMCAKIPANRNFALTLLSGRTNKNRSSRLLVEANPPDPRRLPAGIPDRPGRGHTWVVYRVGSTTVPYGTLKNVLPTLEATRLEPEAYDQKKYAPGIGIVREQALTGAPEFAELVSVSG